MKKLFATAIVTLTATSALACDNGWERVSGSNACQMTDATIELISSARVGDGPANGFRANTRITSVDGELSVDVFDGFGQIFNGTIVEGRDTPSRVK